MLILVSEALGNYWRCREGCILQTQIRRDFLTNLCAHANIATHRGSACVDKGSQISRRSVSAPLHHPPLTPSPTTRTSPPCDQADKLLLSSVDRRTTRQARILTRPLNKARSHSTVCGVRHNRVYSIPSRCRAFHPLVNFTLGCLSPL